MPSFTKERENELKCMYPTVLHLTMLGGGGGGAILGMIPIAVKVTKFKDRILILLNFNLSPLIIWVLE